MDSSNSQDVAHDFYPMFRVYKDGRVERLADTPKVTPSPSADPTTGVRSKDVVLSPESKLSARIYLPKSSVTDHHKLPLLIYFHGGGFAIESAFSTLYHNYLNSLVAAADVIAVSVEYRLAPEHPIPACYDDCWTVLKWVALHAENKAQGPDPWLNEHADFRRVFLAGDSAGANIAHNISVRAGTEGLGSFVNIMGMVLIHPYFGIDKPERLWTFLCPETSGLDDPRFYPAADPNLLAKTGCGKVLVCIASKDLLRERGWSYYQTLKKSGWGGVVEIVETEDEEHVFHLFNPTCEKAGSLMKLVASFIKGSQAP